MAEDRHEKTEQPTHHRLEEARREGSIPISPDLSALGVLTGGILGIVLWGSSLLHNLIIILREQVIESTTYSLNFDQLGSLISVWTGRFLTLILPIMMVIAALSLIINLIQTRGLISSRVAEPRWERIDPVKNIRQRFSIRGWVELLKAGIKIVIVGVVGYWAIRNQLGKIISLSGGEIGAWGKNIALIVLNLSLKILIAFALIAIADYIFQNYKYRRDLMMSRRELKDELRQTEGDPHIRSKIRQLQLQISLNRMIKQLPKADVVITNPTHIAVALEYHQETMNAPKVIAKGKGKLAERIRELARQHSIPIVEDPELARALYKWCEVGSEIPYHLYQAVAQVLAWVYHLSTTKSGYAEEKISP